MVRQDLSETRSTSVGAPGVLTRLLCLALVSLFVLSLCSCSGYKFVRKQELEILAEGIEWYVERAKPREGLEGEEKAKFERVGPKLSRNARALAE